MSDTSHVKWLLVGTGDIVRKRGAAALHDAPNSSIVGVVGGKERAEALASEFDVPHVYTDLDEALKSTEANAAYIATPVYRHNKEAIAAIEAGKHVLIEKPLGLSGDDARQIADAAEQAGVVAGCAYYRRLFDRQKQAKAALAANELGQVVLVRTSLYSWFAPDANDPKLWRTQKQFSGGGPLSDMGCHMFDLIIDLFGTPTHVFARAESLVHGWDVEDSSAIVMKLPNGAQLLASFGWNSKTWTHELEIVGTEARLRWFPSDNGPVMKTVGRDTVEIESPNADNVHQPLVEDFVNAIRTGGQPICPLSSAMQTNRVLDAIYESSRTGKEVTL